MQIADFRQSSLVRGSTLRLALLRCQASPLFRVLPKFADWPELCFPRRRCRYHSYYSPTISSGIIISRRIESLVPSRPVPSRLDAAVAVAAEVWHLDSQLEPVVLKGVSRDF